MPDAIPTETRKGLIAAVVAFGTWGIYPLFYKQLADVASVEVLAHRVTWSLALLAIGMAWMGEIGRSLSMLARPTILLQVLFTTACISLNWYLFIVAVSTDRILEASLGYFLNPVVTAMLGVVFLGERPGPLRQLAIGIAATGMMLTFIVAGVVPIIALSLALSFGLYSLVRKKSPLDSTSGLFLESLLMAPLAIGYLYWFGTPISQTPDARWFWLIASGALTILPLLTVVFAARRIPLSTLGFFQYMAPTAHLLIGVFIYGEVLDLARGIAFGTTLLAILVFLYSTRRPLAQPALDSR